ncbi:MAG: hypothetical protein WCH39_23050 [Schlesneria sp.]
MKFVRSMLVFCAVTALAGGAPGAAFAGNLNVVVNGDFTHVDNAHYNGGVNTAGPYPGVAGNNLDSSLNGKTAAQQVAYNTSLDDATVYNWSMGPGSYQNNPVYVTARGANNLAPAWGPSAAGGGIQNGADLPSIGTDGSAYNGGVVSLDGDPNHRSTLFQGVNVNVGDTYHLSFLYAYGQQHGTTGTVTNIYGQVQWGGSVHNGAFSGGEQFNTTAKTVPSQGFLGWYTFDQDVVATSATELLGFTAYGPGVPPVFFVADISLVDTTTTPSTVPEPSTFAICATGLLVAIGSGLRRRAVKIATA